MVASCVTERLTDSEAAPASAVIAAAPFVTAVRSPAGEIVATFESEELHVTTSFRKIRLSWSRTSADRVAVAPIASNAIPDGEMTIVEASGVFPVMRSQPARPKGEEEPPRPSEVPMGNAHGGLPSSLALHAGSSGAAFAWFVSIRRIHNNGTDQA